MSIAIITAKPCGFRTHCAFDRGDVDAWLDTIDPDIGWDISAHPLPNVPNRGQAREAMLTDMLDIYLSDGTTIPGS